MASSSMSGMMRLCVEYMGIYSSVPCCFGDVPTKYHITIQKTIMQTIATVNVVSENRSRFEKFTMP